MLTLVRFGCAPAVCVCFVLLDCASSSRAGAGSSAGASAGASGDAYVHVGAEKTNNLLEAEAIARAAVASKVNYKLHLGTWWRWCGRLGFALWMSHGFVFCLRGACTHFLLCVLWRRANSSVSLPGSPALDCSVGIPFSCCHWVSPADMCACVCICVFLRRPGCW